MFSAVVPLVRKSRRILIATHKNPDGDAIGAMLGLALGLAQLGKQVHPFSDDPISDMYRVIDGFDRVSALLPADPAAFDLAIAVDAADFQRLPEAAKEVLLKREFPLINLDHHPGNKEFGEVNVVDTAAASATSIIFRLLKELKVKITKPMAEWLYAGHIVDTGRFAFQNTSAQTLAEAAELVAAGADPYRVYSMLFSSHPMSHLKLLARVLDHLSLDGPNRIAWSVIRRADLESTGADASDFEGIPEFLLTTAGADVAILFGENPADDRIRISFRSRDSINISKVAASLGGGGHKNASGAQIHGSLDSVVQRVLETTRQMRGELA